MKNRPDAFNRALHYLSYKMRTKKEISDYLLKKEYDPQEIRLALEKLLEYQLINDQQYAEYYIREKFSVSGHGRHKMFHQLVTKGISADIIKQQLENYFTEHSETEKIEELFLKKYNKLQSHQPKDIYKIYNYLIRKGFPADLVRRVVSKYTNYDE